MTRIEAEQVVSELTEEEKIILYEMLLDLKENPSPSERPGQEDQ